MTAKEALKKAQELYGLHAGIRHRPNAKYKGKHANQPCYTHLVGYIEFGFFNVKKMGFSWDECFKSTEKAATNKD